MFETARLYKTDNFSRIDESAEKIAVAMKDENCKKFCRAKSFVIVRSVNIRPRSNDDQDQYESPFNMANEYKSAYVTGNIFSK